MGKASVALLFAMAVFFIAMAYTLHRRRTTRTKEPTTVTACSSPRVYYPHPPSPVQLMQPPQPYLYGYQQPAPPMMYHPHNTGHPPQQQPVYYATTPSSPRY